MSYVFIAYKREDETRVARIANALQAEGLEIWWDRGLPAGESWHAEIDAKLEGAGCVVVVWSFGSIAPDGFYVRDEARRGLQRRLLVPVLIDPARNLPLGFGEVQAVDLTRWRGARRDPFFIDLVATIRAKLAGADEPPARGPLARLRRRLVVGGTTATTFAVLALLALHAFGVTARICEAPGLQPTLSDACGAYHLGGRPSREERLAWAARPENECQALRAHINRFPTGAYASEAMALLSARQLTYIDDWSRSTRDVPILAPRLGAGARSETEARAAAIAAARDRPAATCRAFAASTLFRFVSASLLIDNWSCGPATGGVSCSFAGRVRCVIDERRPLARERCGPLPGSN